MNLAIPRFVYQPCDPALVGEIHYYTQHAMGSEAAAPLRTYLERYDGLTLDEVNANPYSGREIVLILPDEVVPEDSSAPMTMLWIEVCRQLARAGFSILCVGKSKITFGMMGAFLILGAEQEAEQKQLVMSVPDVDILVTFSHKETLQWAEAKQKIKLTFSPANKTDSEAANEIAAEIKSRLVDTILPEPETVRNEALWSRALRKVKYLLTK
jgi:hypothetical protein